MLIRWTQICIAVTFVVLSGCSSYQQEKETLLQTITELRSEVNELKTQQKSMETENTTLSAKLQAYEDKMREKLLNPDVYYSSLMFDLPTYVGIDGYMGILGGKKNLVTFYADGRGLVLSPLPTDTTAGTMFIPYEFRYRKDDTTITFCVDSEVELQVFEESCYAYEYKMDKTTKTLTMFNETEQAIFQQYHIQNYVAGRDY